MGRWGAPKVGSGVIVARGSGRPASWRSLPPTSLRSPPGGKEVGGRDRGQPHCSRGVLVLGAVQEDAPPPPVRSVVLREDAPPPARVSVALQSLQEEVGPFLEIYHRLMSSVIGTMDVSRWIFVYNNLLRNLTARPWLLTLSATAGPPRTSGLYLSDSEYLNCSQFLS